LTTDRSKFRAKERDIVALLNALQELFQESGDEVTPKQLKERMEQKLHTQVPLHLVVSAYTSLGFVSRKSSKHGEERFIIPNPALLAERRAQFLRADISPNK
jgi:hypothetical protein